MIRGAWRRTVRFLSSARVATRLLALVGVWSVAAAIIPQGGASDPKVAAWASQYPLIEPVVRTIGLHQAFTSPVFVGCILALTVSTALCAWKRTRVAAHKARTLGEAARCDERSLAENHDLEIACGPALEASEVLSKASETLADLGIKTKRRGAMLHSVSSGWSVWGSPIFHWALLALIVVIFAGNLQRSEGLMGVAVGQTKADAPDSYGKFDSGPLYRSSDVRRSIRVDAFEPQYRVGGIDRGPTPTVSVVDGEGRVIKTQRVYPNNQLKTGSLAIYPNAYGLSVAVSLVNTSGAEVGRSVRFVDFSDTAENGTTSAGYLTVSDRAGNPELYVSVTVPLESHNGHFDQVLPDHPKARVLVTAPDGSPLVDSLVSPSESVALPTGESLRVDSIGYYARLQLVDDWSTIPLYACLFVGTLGLTITVVARQQIVLVTVIEGPEGRTLAATVRLWRNASTSREKAESELARALGRGGKESKG